MRIATCGVISQKRGCGSRGSGQCLFSIFKSRLIICGRHIRPGLFPSRQIQEQYHVFLERYKNDVFESEGDFPSQARWVPLLNMNQLLSSKILHEINGPNDGFLP